MKRAMLLCCCAVLLQATYVNAQTDTTAYRNATAIKAPAEKIHALEAFLAAYPASAFMGNAYNILFGLYVDQGNESASLNAADHYLQTVPPESRANPYNGIAYELATKNIGLDTALAYATRAEELARSQGSNMLAAIIDTRAFVFYRLGNSGEAEKLQKVAIRGHEDDPEYVSHLALYQEGNGRRREALSTMSRALYLGGGPELRDTFLTWVHMEGKDTTGRTKLKESVIMSTVHTFIDTLKGKRATIAKSDAAAFMARMGVDLATAEKWAMAALRDEGNDAPVEETVGFKQNLSVVYAALGKDREGLKILQSVQDLVSPWSSEFWLTLGKSYERVGEPGKAIHAYMQGLIATNPNDLRRALENVYAREHGSIDSLDAEIDRMKQAGASFDPGKYNPKKPGNGKVVLAELFTGAECGPCVSSDLAFDALREYFPASDLAILEYHVHVPGPDPLTTNETWNRFRSYGGGGTPTVVIDGKEKIVGGGPKFIARNRFELYRYAIQKREAERPAVQLALNMVNSRDRLSVEAQVERSGGSSTAARPVLYIALVERSVDYTGGNGISRHGFVVRKLIGGTTGIPLALSRKTESIKEDIDVAEVEQTLRKMLDDPKSQPCWPKWIQKFSGWRSRPEKIDRSNLGVVAWVQDMDTMDVLQAAYRDVPTSMSAN